MKESGALQVAHMTKDIEESRRLWDQKRETSIETQAATQPALWTNRRGAARERADHISRQHGLLLRIATERKRMWSVSSQEP